MMMIGEPVHGVEPPTSSSRIFRIGARWAFSALRLRRRRARSPKRSYRRSSLDVALSFEQSGKHSIAIGGRQFQERLFRADRGERVRHARALGKAMTSALWPAQWRPHASSIWRRRASTSSSSRAYGLSEDDRTHGRDQARRFPDPCAAPSPRCERAPGIHGSSTGLPVIGSCQSPRRCSRLIR